MNEGKMIKNMQKQFEKKKEDEKRENESHRQSISENKT